MKTTPHQNRKAGIGFLLWLVIAGAGAIVGAIVLALVVTRIQSQLDHWRSEWIWTDNNIGPALPPLEVDPDSPMAAPVDVDCDEVGS